MKRKLFSMLVIVCMIVALLPAVSAEVGTTYEYKLNPGVANNTKIKDYGYDDTNDVWAWAGSNPSDSGPANAYAHKWGICTNTTAEGRWLALKIKINESGIYSASLSHAKSKSNGGIGAIYLLTESTEDIGSALLTATSIGEVSFYNSGEDVPSTSTPLSDVTIKNGEEGEYILVFYASKPGNTGYQMYPNTLTLTKKADIVSDETVDTMVSVSVLSEENGTVSVEGDYKVIDEVPMGTKITAIATAKVGYTFAYWKNSAGMWLSSNAKETFTINTNTAVIAVYEKIPAAEDTSVPVYFYNGNGSFIESKSVEKGSLFGNVKIENPSLTGFAFDKWSVLDDTAINALTRAVALYKDSDVTYNVTVNGNVVSSGKKYGESVTVSSVDEDFTCWKLGDDIVSYDKDFEFDVYGDVALTEVCEGATEAYPTVALDIKGEEHFIVYNVPAGYTRIEAGILFGDGNAPEIGSFYSKASEKTGSGQFTAKASGKEENPVALGYLLFKDSEGTVKVIYTAR